jgi:HD-like signal output (HDOD) protein
MKQVAHLVCLASEHANYRSRDPEIGTMLKELWLHASSTAMAAQWLATRLRLDSIEEECFPGGLLHDVGQLWILRVIDEIQDEGGYEFIISGPLIKEVLLAELEVMIEDHTAATA